MAALKRGRPGRLVPMPLDRPRIGSPAPEIDLVTIDGERWRLSDHRGRPLVVTFHRHIH